MLIGYRQLSSDRGYCQLSDKGGYRQLSSDRVYRQLSNDRGYRQLSNDRGYRQLSNDRGGVPTASRYEYGNDSSLYAYDNPSANNDIISDGLLSFGMSHRYPKCGSGNPTFMLDATDMSSSHYIQQQRHHHQQTATGTMSSLSLPYLRRAGDYSNYFSQDSVEPLKRPTALEVCIMVYNCMSLNT